MNFLKITSVTVVFYFLKNLKIFSKNYDCGLKSNIFAV